MTPALPKAFCIDTHNYCNAACDYCPYETLAQDKDYPMGTMDWTLFCSIVDEIAMAGAEEVRFGNLSESLIHPSVWKYMEYALKKSLPLYIATNMTHLDVIAMDRLDGMGFLGEVHAHVQPDMGVDHDLQEKHFELAIDRWPGRVHRVVIKGGGHTWPGWNSTINRKVTSCSINKPEDQVVICWDGRMQLCCIDVRQEVIIGTVTVDRGVCDVWDSGVGRIIEQRNAGELSLCNRCEYGC